MICFSKKVLFLLCISFNLSSMAMFSPQRFLKCAGNRLFQQVPVRMYASGKKDPVIWSNTDRSYTVEKDRNGNFLLIREPKRYSDERGQLTMRTLVLRTIAKKRIEAIKAEKVANADDVVIEELMPEIKEAIEVDHSIISDMRSLLEVYAKHVDILVNGPF